MLSCQMKWVCGRLVLVRYQLLCTLRFFSGSPAHTSPATWGFSGPKRFYNRVSGGLVGSGYPVFVNACSWSATPTNSLSNCCGPLTWFFCPTPPPTSAHLLHSDCSHAHLIKATCSPVHRVPVCFLSSPVSAVLRLGGKNSRFGLYISGK